MASPPRHMHWSYAEYLALEEASPTRHEYLDGEIYGMAGGTPDHAALAAAVIAALGGRLPPGCRTFTSDLRVRIEESGFSTCADATVVCGPTQRANDDRLAVVNPVVLVEVTSPSTEDYDRGAKLALYQQIPSLREVLFVSHREPWLTVVRRARPRWTPLEARRGGSVTLEALPVTLDVDALYSLSLEDVR